MSELFNSLALWCHLAVTRIDVPLEVGRAVVCACTRQGDVPRIADGKLDIERRGKEFDDVQISFTGKLILHVAINNGDCRLAEVLIHV